MKFSANSIAFGLLFFWTLGAAAWPPDTSLFYWGVANSAFQTEGHPADSDWYRWSHTIKKVKDPVTGELKSRCVIKNCHNADVATDFWDLYDTDFKLARDLGSTMFRMSIAWERIEPAEGQWDDVALTHYETMIEEMRARGMEPMITLFHSTLPVWLANRGGLLAPDFPQAFARYAEHVVSRLAAGPARVTYWLTVNEPATLAEGKYLNGTDTPGERGAFRNFLRAIAAQARAHILATRRLRALPGVGSNIHLGIATDWTDFSIQSSWKNPLSFLVTRLARKVGMLIYDRKFLNAAVKAGTLDFIGLNYYTRIVVKTRLGFIPVFGKGNGPQADSGMEIYPEGMLHSLLELNKYHLPLIVTENGLADGNQNDVRRQQFLRDHIAKLMEAREKYRIPVFGYLYWSLTDNFEWSSGYTQDYGLVAVDSKTMKRSPRPSFETYKNLIREYSSVLSPAPAPTR